MWQYALRTERDLLPPHYRHQPLYFRRPPRLPPRQLKDAHLLLLRELAAQPMDFEQLQQATGLGSSALARHLSALYVVGAITANPRRSAPGTIRHNSAEPFSAPNSNTFGSVLDSMLAMPTNGRRPVCDLTAPAPLVPE
jgi:hypothetical protein